MKLHQGYDKWNWTSCVINEIKSVVWYVKLHQWYDKNIRFRTIFENFLKECFFAAFRKNQIYYIFL